MNDSKINERSGAFGGNNAPGANHSPAKFGLDARLPSSDALDPLKNGGDMVKKEIGTPKTLMFNTYGTNTGHGEASQFPMPLNRSYADFPGTKLSDAPPRSEVTPSKVSDTKVSHSSKSSIF